MPMIDRDGTPLAYEFTPGEAPAVVFLGGFKSDMQGTKALALEAWARARGQAFLRLDYSGHGQSGGTFEAGSIGAWYADALAVIAHEITQPCVLVGSSMGGWIALLIAREHPSRVAGLVTIAAAPDFTEDGYWASFDEAQRVALFEAGRVAVPSDYGEPYVITKHLIEEGRERLVLRSPLPLPVPTRFLQGTADADVPEAWAHRLLAHAEGPDIRLTLVKGADHRFSEPDQIALIERSVEEVLDRIAP
ncbi:alpha/beta fold hydrolase [Jannaschia seohaensis]|uniref:Palmitoyl-protein thioesterase ABHD10, mitochondrial n=1 Tax=Jannaschia seohaensis TaxID=475081 RepID=A0A2Y9A9T2_9RHOB|nr:alpha/beta hydrolase [Jannaschia seohaensis]PWJ20871.1 pimeloyl-ACP methyl ester carboxylesterase [Jannaschia seohaensis]SSA41281.1 Pimeloyl-ACP methyl ester carboxylesterase [Jannaschia seohaensis]